MRRTRGVVFSGVTATAVVLVLVVSLSGTALATTQSQSVSALAGRIGSPGLRWDTGWVGGEVRYVAGMWARVDSGFSAELAYVYMPGTARLTYPNGTRTGLLAFSGRPGGTARMDIGVWFIAQWKAQVAGVGFGPYSLPGIPNINYRLRDEKSISSYLLGSSVTLSDYVGSKRIINTGVGIPGVAEGGIEVTLAARATNRISGRRLNTSKGTFYSEGTGKTVTVSGTSFTAGSICEDFRSQPGLVLTPGAGLYVTVLWHTYRFNVPLFDVRVPLGTYDGRTSPCRTVTFGLPNIAVSPSSINFGDVIVGQTVTRHLTIRNTGRTTLNVSNVTVSGSGFRLSSSRSFSISAGSSRSASVTFRPGSAGSRSGTLSTRVEPLNSSILTRLSRKLSHLIL